MRQQTKPRGITRIEVMVLFAIFIIIFAILTVYNNSNYTDRRRRAYFVKDATQIREICQSMIVSSRELDTSLLLPSLVAQPTTNGKEDYSLNHSANLYSLMIMRHYETPQLLISPLEVSDHIIEDEDYDYNKYDPLNNSYWDDSFVMHIEDPKIGANASYAHIAAIGDRRDILRTSKAPSGIPILGTRAYDQTLLNPSDYLRSPVLRISGPPDRWIGSIAFADGHTTTIETFFPQLTSYDPGSGAVPDNIFAAEFDHPNGKQAAADAFLCISIAASQYTVNDVYDPLIDD